MFNVYKVSACIFLFLFFIFYFLFFLFFFSLLEKSEKKRMEPGALVFAVMGACVCGCICAICAIERAFELLDKHPLLEPLYREQPVECENSAE
jgi:hypothetical protein